MDAETSADTESNIAKLSLSANSKSRHALELPASCAACGKKAHRPVLTCMLCTCKTPPSEAAELPVYCELACQAVDKKRHDNDCRGHEVRRIISRAGEFLRAAFYMWREAVFDIALLNVQRSAVDGRLHLYYTWERPEEHQNEIVVPFPNGLVPAIADKQSLLTFNACSDGTAYMVRLADNMLKGYMSGGDEVHVYVHKTFHDMVRHMSDQGDTVDNSAYVHELFSLRGTDGQVYALDISGAQYRNDQPVMLYEDYEHKFVARHSEAKPWGYRAQSMRDDLEGKHDSQLPRDWDLRVQQLHSTAHDCFNAAFTQWEKERGKSLQDLLRGSKAEFEAGKDSAMAYANHKLEAFVANWKANGCKLTPRGSYHSWSDVTTRAPMHTWRGFSRWPKAMQEEVAEAEKNPSPGKMDRLMKRWKGAPAMFAMMD